MAQTPRRTESDVRSDWCRLAYLLLRVDYFPIDRMPPVDVNYVHELDLIRHLDRVVETFGLQGEIQVERLTELLAEIFSPSLVVDALGSFPEWSTARIMGVKAIRYALALAADRLDMVPPHERQPVRDMLQVAASVPAYSELASRTLARIDRLAEPARTRETLPEVGGPVEFRHVWRPWSTHGKGETCYAGSSGLAEMEVLDARDAPVLARLRAGVGGGDLIIRSLDGVPVRPLLAPGTWRPISLGEFRDAARDGRAWADSPFSAKRKGSAPAHLGLDDVIVPVHRPNRRDSEARADAEKACLRRAGRLFAIDGVVHRATGSPRLHVAVTRVPDFAPNDWDARIGLAWSVGGQTCLQDVDLATWNDQETFRSRPHREGFLVDWPWARRSGVGFAPEMQDVLVRALILFGEADGVPRLRPDIQRVVQGYGQPCASDLDEASGIAEAVKVAIPRASARSSTAEMWRAACETDIRRLFAKSLASVVKRDTEELDAELDLLASL